MTTSARDVQKRVSVVSRFMAVCVLFLIAITAAAQNPPAGAQAQVTSASFAAQESPAATQGDILPVFALDVNFDPSWIDSVDVPSKSAHYSNNGVNDAFQNAWEMLKPAGFRTIRFTIDLRDTHSAARLSNLCIWAKANNVNLIAVLEHYGSGNAVGEFPGAFVSRMRAGDGRQFAAYNQLLQVQLGSAMNVGGQHPEIKAGETQKTLLAAIHSFRNAEAHALEGSGVAPSPIVVSASFDYELIQQSAIVGAALDSADEQKAQASLKRFLEPLAASANVDAINIEWFPGTLSPGDADRFAILVRELETALPGKHVMLTTGFSSAFNPADQQNQFLTLATTKLWNFRVADGADSSHFLGVVFEQALKEPGSDSTAPAGSGDPSHWNWKEKTPLLSRMLSGGKSSAELKWWLSKVRGNMALIAVQSDPSGPAGYTPLPALQVFQQISTAVAQARQSITPTGMTPSANQAPAIAPDTQNNPGSASNSSTASSAATPAGSPTQVSAAASPSPYQQLMLTLVQQASTQLTTALVTKMTTGSGNKTQAQYPTPAIPDPAAAAQTPSPTVAAQPQVPAPPDGGNPPQASTASGGSSFIPSSHASGSVRATPAQVSSTTATSPNPQATTAPTNTGASTSGTDVAGANRGQQGSSTGTASGQAASAPAARSPRPATTGSTLAAPTTSQVTPTPQPVASTQPTQSATAAPPPSPRARGVQPSPVAQASATAGTAQPSGAPAATQLARPGPGSANAPSAPATNSVPAAVPTTTNQLIRPGPRSASAPPSPGSGIAQTPPSARPNGPAVPASGQPDLSVSPADIRITPTAIGQISVTAIIRNAGKLGTGAATVVFRVAAGGKQLAASQPIVFSMPANGTFQTAWTASVPPGQSLQLSVSVSAAGDSNLANNQAVLAFTTPAAATARR